MKIEFNNEKEWLEFRKGKIGGTSISAILNKNPYKTKTQVYRLLKGIEEVKDISTKDCVVKGKKAEPLIIELWGLDHPEFEVIHFQYVVFTDDKRSYLYSSPDGMAIEKETGNVWMLEVKTSELIKSSSKEKWSDGRIPSNYYCQTLLETHTNPESKGTIIIAELKYSDDYTSRVTRIISKEKHQEDIDYMLEQADKFWNENVLKDVEPNLTLDI